MAPEKGLERERGNVMSNPNIEIRNTKQAQNHNVRMTKTGKPPFRISVIPISCLFRVSVFGFRFCCGAAAK